MAKDTNADNSGSGKSKKDLVKEAQAEQQAVLTQKRLDFIEALKDHESIGGADDVEKSLLEIVQRYPEGIEYSFLQSVFPGTALTEAREALKTKGEIEQIGKKGNIVLKPVV